MIFLLHKNNKVIKITINNQNIPIYSTSIVENLSFLSKKYKMEQIIWCHSDFENHLNLKFIHSVPLNTNKIISFNPFKDNFINTKLGYIDQNSILKINKNVTYQTWQLNASVGVISSILFCKLEKYINKKEDFNYLLNSIAKRTFMNGILCYSEPKLFQNLSIEKSFSCSNFTLFQFVKQHYNLKWLFLLLLNVFLYERKFLVFPFFKALFYKRKPTINDDFISSCFEENKINNSIILDVIIPTIGRANYLFDFLNDLKAQQLLPQNVIIIEQNPNNKAISELNYLENENWPFKIKHQFIHQSGACNARNLALKQVTSDWVFFADDDIRISVDFLKNAFQKIQSLNANAVMFSCLLKNQTNTFLIPHQTSIFGSGCSIVNAKFTSQVNFDTKFEFCFGEDSDYGMKLRNLGTDVIYLPEPKIVHLKAPIGGFRTKPTYLWSNDEVFPKPSPTILLNLYRHATLQQQNGFKTFYFIKTINWKKPLKSYKIILKKWKSSLMWANKLQKM